LTLASRFIHGWGLRETLEFKGFGWWSSLFDKKSFTYLQIVIGNPPAMI
jgi:hypothetical protein